MTRIKHWFGIHKWQYIFHQDQFGDYVAERHCQFCGKFQTLEFYSNHTRAWVDNP